MSDATMVNLQPSSYGPQDTEKVQRLDKSGFCYNLPMNDFQAVPFMSHLLEDSV